MTSMEST